jgi:hypothetical protein
VGLLGLLLARQARAAGVEEAAFGALGLVAPSEFGVAASDPSNPRLAIGWTWQIPVVIFMDNPPAWSELIHHRVVLAADLLPQDGPSWRGRFGYRYDRSHLFAGAGVGVDRAGVNLSPEVGVKFLQAVDEPKYAEIAPDSGRLRGCTFYLGWNLI